MFIQSKGIENKLSADMFPSLYREELTISLHWFQTLKTNIFRYQFYVSIEISPVRKNN